MASSTHGIDPRQNHLLGALRDDEFERIAAALEPVRLARPTELEGANEPIKFVYFPTSGVASIIALEASTGGQALMLATEHRPALVLMDIRLPDMDGVEALGRLRMGERTASIPVLAVTAQAMKGDSERFKAAGFDGYLSKPLDIDGLLVTVELRCRRSGG